MKDIISLGIETSCDETAASVVLNGREILSNVISSQIDIHKVFGGVVPEIASRNHVEAVDSIVKEAVKGAGLGFDKLDIIGVTVGAGLVGALLVGLSYAKGLKQTSNIPLYAVNHIEGHICANYLSDKDLTPPFLCLMASGGHTAIINVVSYTDYEIICSTVDDAVGEAFDKVARVLGLGYPGGIQIDKLSRIGEHKYKYKSIITSNGNFSYSGLKTALISQLNGFKQKNIRLAFKSQPEENAVYVEDICRSFSEAATNGLYERLRQIITERKPSRLAVAGGVGANSMLRSKLTALSREFGLRLTLPELALCTDNGAMIASQAYFMHAAGISECPLSQNALPTLKLRGERPK